MPTPELAAVLRMRVGSELARMADLERVLAHAAGRDESRRTGLRNRITARTGWATQLRDHDDWTAWDDGADDADLLVDEMLALLTTRLFRLQGLDEGTFDAAEIFLAELLATAGLSGLVLGSTQELESINHTRASVALRFPGSRIWDLPFLAHEVGHHAVAQLRHLEPGLAHKPPLARVAAGVAETLVQAGRPATTAVAHADELVADAVATVCCGPAYPVACLCLRVPAGAKAAKATGSHPSWHERIAATRSTLDQLTARTGQARYRAQCAKVVDPLVEDLLGRIPAATAAATDAGQLTVDAIVKHRVGLIYQAADSAIEVAKRLQRRAPGPPPGATVTAVVDGAWRWRREREDEDQDEDVAALAVGYILTLAPGR